MCVCFNIKPIKEKCSSLTAGAHGEGLLGGNYGGLHRFRELEGEIKSEMGFKYGASDEKILSHPE